LDNQHIKKMTSARDNKRQADREIFTGNQEAKLTMRVECVTGYAIFMTDPNGIVQTWNSGAQHITGKEAQEMIGQHISIFYLPEDLEKNTVIKNLALARDKGSHEDEGWRLNNAGLKFWVHVHYTAIYDNQERLTGYAVIVRDMTEFKAKSDEQERLIDQRTEELKNAFERITDAVMAFDNQWNYTYVNQKAAEIMGIPKEELIGQNLWNRFPGEQKLIIHKLFKQAMEEQRSIQTECFYPPLKIWIHATMYPSSEGLSVYLQDISARKQTEQALLESQEKYRQIVDTAQEGIWMIDQHNKTVFVNRKMCEMLEYSEHEMQGRPIAYFMDDAERQQSFESLDRRQKGVIEELEKLLITKTGKHIIVHMSANPIYERDGKYEGALAMVSDITEKIKLQRELSQQQERRQKELSRAEINAQEKERTKIGEELHDNINQLLVTSKLFLGHALQTGQYKTNTIRSMECINQAVEEIRQLSKGLVGPSRAASIGLVASVTDLVIELSALKNIQINFDHDSFQEEITDEGLKLIIYRIIQEQLNNIFKHAESSEVTIQLVHRDAHLELWIKDNGKGFDTTKKRKGIGLANIAGRVIAYNGKVEIFSSPGNGCSLGVIFNLFH
jgi:PAS domain S-box-containing protein